MGGAQQVVVGSRRQPTRLRVCESEQQLLSVVCVRPHAEIGTAGPGPEISPSSPARNKTERHSFQCDQNSKRNMAYMLSYAGVYYTHGR